MRTPISQTVTATSQNVAKVGPDLDFGPASGSVQYGSTVATSDKTTTSFTSEAIKSDRAPYAASASTGFDPALTDPSPLGTDRGGFTGSATGALDRDRATSFR